MKTSTFLALVLALLVEVALLGLAYWQYTRMIEKQTMATQQAMQPHHTLVGVWEVSATVVLDNQPHPHHGAVGWRVFTPLHTQQGVVIVDRGWMPPPPNRMVPPNPRDIAPTTQHVSGQYAPFPTRKGVLAGPDTTAHPRMLAWLNPALITSATVGPTYMQATTPTSPHIVPLPPAAPSGTRHAAYALQWLAMAVVFLVLVRRRLIVGS